MLTGNRLMFKRHTFCSSWLAARLLLSIKSRLNWKMWINGRRRCFRRKYAQHPSLATIPEGSTLTASSLYHRPKIDGRLRILFLILFPVYIITTSVMIRALHRFDRQQSGIRKTLQNFERSRDPVIRGIQKNQELFQQTMAIKRVVYIGSKKGSRTYRWIKSADEMVITRHNDNLSPHVDVSSSRQYNANMSQHDDQLRDEESPYQQLKINADECCEPMAKWQSMSFPTCNSLHELNVFSTNSYLALRSPATTSSKRTNPQHKIIQDTYSAKILGNGWFRDAWKVSDEVTNTTFAIKTLRLERDFMSEYFELHRRDSVALERLSESQYIMVSAC